MLETLSHGKTIASMDGAEHRRNRGLVAQAFSKRTVEKWTADVVRPAAQENVARLLRRVEQDGEADLLADFVLDFPAKVITTILGLPDDDVPVFVRTAFAMVTFSNVELATEAAQVMYDWIADLTLREREKPLSDNLISQLVHAEVDGERLTTDEIAAFLRILFVAGFETTMKGLSNVLTGLLTSGQWELLVQDRGLIPQAVDEGLRWQTSVLAVPRVAAQDHELFGVSIPRGSVVMCFIAAANHDPARWDDPHRFDILREQKPHMAFGLGQHLCLGMQLARAEISTALEVLLDAVPGLELLEGREDDLRIRGLASRGPRAIPVRLSPVAV